MTQQIIKLGTHPDDHTGTPLNTGGDMINDNFTELYAMKALFEGLGLNFITHPFDASHGGSFKHGAVAVIPAPGTGKAIKVIGCMLSCDPTTPLNIGTQVLNVCYGNPPDGTSQDIGYFPNYYLKNPTSCLAGMTEPKFEYRDIHENQAVGVGFSGDADITSGISVMVIYMWYTIVTLLDLTGTHIVTDKIPPPPPITTISESPDEQLDGKDGLYVCSHPTTQIDLILDDVNWKGNTKIMNLGNANVTAISATGGTVTIGGISTIVIQKGETVEVSLASVDGVKQFIVLTGIVRAPEI